MPLIVLIITAALFQHAKFTQAATTEAATTAPTTVSTIEEDITTPPATGPGFLPLTIDELENLVSRGQEISITRKSVPAELTDRICELIREGREVQLSQCDIEGDIDFTVPDGRSSAVLSELASKQGLVRRYVLGNEIKSRVSIVLCHVNGNITAWRRAQRRSAASVGDRLGVLFRQSLVLSGTTADSFDFTGCVFLEQLRCRGINASDDMSFAWCGFTAPVDFGPYQYGRKNRLYTKAGWANFENAEFRSRLLCRDAMLTGVFFRRCQFLDLATFDRTTFEGADFDEAQFQHAASFREAIFKAGASFEESIFLGRADFSSSQVLPGGPYSFAHACFKDAAIFETIGAAEELRFEQAVFGNMVSFNGIELTKGLDLTRASLSGNLELAGVNLKRDARLDLTGVRCKDIVFGDWKRRDRGEDDLGDLEPSTRESQDTQPAATRRRRSFFVNDPEHLDGIVDFDGAIYSGIRLLPWEHLVPCLKRGLGKSEPDGTMHEPRPTDSELAALRELARNYQRLGSDREAKEAYAFYRRQELNRHPLSFGLLVWLTTDYGAKKWLMLIWWAGVILIPWFVYYSSENSIVRAKDSAPEDKLWTWAQRQSSKSSCRRLAFAAMTLAFSMSTFAPGINLVSYDRWTASDEPISKRFPIHFTTVGSFQRIAGWILVPLGIAAFAGLFVVN